jgi:hypothetical protein
VGLPSLGELVKYAVASQSLGRVLDMRDTPYTAGDIQNLAVAYGVSDIEVHQDVDVSILDFKACVAVKIEDGAIVEDVAATADAEHEKALEAIVELYRVKVAMEAAVADGFAMEDELAAVVARINESRGELAEIVARKVADVSFFTRMLTYLGLK